MEVKNVKKKMTVISLMALVAVIVAGVVFGSGIATADSDTARTGWIMGRGTVSTPESELVRGYRFRLNARVNENGSATGSFAARVHLRYRTDAVTDQANRIVRIQARFDEGTLAENHAKLAGTARAYLANGEVLTDLPFKLGTRLGERGEYGMVLHVGDRVIEGKGVSGDVIISLNR